MAKAHLVCGSTGAGKTAYAMRLAGKTGAIRFSIDECMHRLYFADAPEPLSYQWALERVERCEAQILALCAQLAPAGTDVILDFGFFTRVQRGPALERMQFAALGDPPFKLGIFSSLRTALILLELGTNKGESCSEIYLEVSADNRLVTITVDTTNKFMDSF